MSSKSILALAIAVILHSFGWIAPLHGQNQMDITRFAFTVGTGVSAPLNPTGQYAGVSAHFVGGMGYAINRRSAILGEYMWSNLPSNLFIVQPVDFPELHSDLHSLTTNYRYQIDSIKDSIFGVYGIAGGGWYYRRTTLDREYVFPPNTVCLPIYGWWGYSCDQSGYVVTETVARRGISAGGVNAGTGFTIRLSDEGLKYYTEARYHYAWSGNIPTTLVHVTLGIRFN
jgi:hypothetical protein